MARSVTTELEGFGGGRYLRLYLKRSLTVDSAFPYRAGQPVRTEIVETTGGKEVLAILPETLEVDVDASELALRRSTREVQADLEANGGDADA